MFHENEKEKDKVMKACRRSCVGSDGSWCRHMFVPFDRMRKPASCVKHLRWLHIQLLVVLLAGQASSQTTAAPSTLSATTNAQTSVYYLIDVNVDVSGEPTHESEIETWLIRVFQTKLESCVSSNFQTTTSSTLATSMTATTLQSNNTTTAATSTALISNNTTTAATSTVLISNNTTTAATSTALISNNTTTAATSTALIGNKTTTAATSTALISNNTTTAATNQFTAVATTHSPTSFSSDSSTTTTNRGGAVKPSNNPNPNSIKLRIAREIHSETQISGISNDTTGLYQGIEVSCKMKTVKRNTNCIVTLQLKQSVPPCCILRTLCAASKTSSDIQVVGKKADRANKLQSECNSTQEEESCIYTGQVGASCEDSGSAYVPRQSNSTNCTTDKPNNCSCSDYCSGSNTYYTLQLTINHPTMSVSDVLSLISKIKELKCSSSSDSCSLATVASEYKGAKVTCGSTAEDSSPQSCSVILGFASKVNICDVQKAVETVFQSDKQITFGSVTRAAICGNSLVSDNPLQSQFTLMKFNLTPAMFCTAIEESDLITCQNGKNVVALLEEQCVQATTPPSPNVTTTQPNNTTSFVNVTFSPLNTTTEAPNAITTAGNVTVTATLKTTATTTNESVTESPTPTQSAESQANALLEMTRDMSKLNSSQVDQLVSLLESLLSGPTVSLELGNISVHIVSNLLDASPETLSDSSDRIIGIVDTVALKLVLEQKPETLLSPAVALSVKPADGTNFQETFFSISDPNNVQVRGNPRLGRSVRSDSTTPQGSIRLPPTLTEDLTSEEQQLASRVQFNFYQKSTVFQDRSMGERRLNSGILGASVANLSITELQDDVVIHLKNTEPVPGNFVAKCVFWDFTLNDGSGGWNSRGCFVRNSTDNETICACNHLTSFAILLDLAREPLTSRLQATILTFITYIGCGVSAIFLSITLLTYLAFGKLRKDIPSKILIQLCLALLLLNLVFLVDAWLALYPDALGLCISTAWFLHYFLLVSFTWMGLEAVHMYLALVKVFNTYISHYMVKFSLVGWGVPMIVVIIVIAIDKNNYGLVSYGKFPDGTSDDFCWLKNDIAFYVAVVAYFCVIFLFNIVMFTVVLVQLCRIKRQNPHNALHRSTLQDARSVAGITILLGLTWGFAFFAWGPVNLAFMYLFAIFNSLQGFFIFVFHCAVKENVRKQWRTYLCCGRMRLAENSEWSRTATQKTVKKSSVTRLTSLHSSESSKSNNSSSSSSFLVSGSSEQINGIGSPFEDRAITADEDHSTDVILNEINSQNRNQQAT
ncbi:adhesion G-protein coupled receptor G2 isoform X2 [Larimichthys crocea]|uniref:adhesion G-protein coupled receptor G2 isoform X2 n=1 Tax=Larimichthys crocea TaxID=215358 RepID=UPI000F5E859A|nr:adhesion G-protein coupled receptor G2-like isoform X2 [Larimichthys crocea]